VYRGAGSLSGAPPLIIQPRHGEARLLPNVPPGWWFGEAAVSPDGKRFVVDGTPVGLPRTPASSPAATVSNSDLFVYQLPAGPMSRLPTPDREVAPTWLPGGEEVGFTRLTVDTPRTWTVMRHLFGRENCHKPSESLFYLSTATECGDVHGQTLNCEFGEAVPFQ